MNKRMILSGGMLVFMAAIVAGGTGAFFSDTETSVGNVFTAGSVSIDLLDVEHDYYGNDNNAPVFDWMGGQGRFTLDDLKPLDTGMLDLDLVNGANEAHVCAMITGNPGDLGDAKDIALYDQLNFFQDDGTQVVPGTWFDLGIANPNGPVGTGVDYCFGEANVDGTGLVSCDYGDGSIEYNDAQNGSFAADLMFYAIQTRNNESFSCDQLTENANGDPVYEPGDVGVEVPQEVFVGADVSTFTSLVLADSDQCDVTVGAGQTYSTIQEGIDAAGTGETVCVAAGTYEEDVNVNKEITLSGDGAGATSVINGQVPNFGGAVVIAANNVTVEGFEINGAAGSQHAVRFATGVSGGTFSDNVVNAPNGGNALLTQGNQSNHTIQNNQLVGNASPQVAYVNGSASLSQPSDDVDFINNSFGGTMVTGGMALGNEATNVDITGNNFSDSLTSTYTIVESWEADAMITFNNFNGVGGTKVTDSNAGTNVLNAENNWWGEATPSGHISGEVDDDPKAAAAYLLN